ncbi:MAG: hypothetical protein [Bacteriophage sp.]|nr:MAG: hypothetical protein [Bacteriophage sp.]
MTEFDLNNPFNDASKDGMLPDGCGIFERYYTSGQEVDFCGLSPNPDDYETPQTLYEKILELVKRIIVAVDLNTNGTYKPSDFDIYPLIANATSVKDAVERLSKYIEDLQQKKFDKLNLKLKYENGNVSLVFNGEAYTTINIPEEQFLDSEETKFISAATIDDYMNDSSVIVGKPYLKLSFKTIDASGKPSITYTYIPMTYLFNVYGVEDTNSIDMHMVASGDTNVFSGDLRINDVSSNALKVDALGAYVEDLNPIIEAEQIRAEAAEKTLTDDLAKEVTRATNMEYNIINMVSNETDRAIEAEKKLQDQITTEVNRASNTEQQLYDRIQAEQTRAVRVEGDLRDDLNFEIQRSTNKDIQLENAIKAEQTRAEASEKTLTDEIVAETNRAKNEEARIEKDLNDKIIDNSDALAAEVTRAKSEETRIETKFDTLVSANTTAIETEVTRATNAEAALNKKIEDETTRAKAAEKVNADAIVTETTRATNRENELDADIKNRIKSITGSNGINATTDINKNVTLSGKIKSGDKILSVDSNGFSSTLGMSISGKTISLTGIGNSEISKITVPGDDLTFAGSNGITVVKSGDTVTSTIIVDPNSSNQLTKSSTGLMVNPENITLVDSTGGTKILTTTANLVIVNVTSQLNYIGISNSKQDKIAFFNNSALEVLFSFNNSSAGTNKFVKDYIITSLTLPSKGSIDFVKRNDGWHISSLFGLSYFPDLGDSSRSDDYALIVKKDGTATIEEIVDMKAWDESILSDLSAVQLENMFPNAHAGFQLVCYSNNCIYEKANELGGWLKINCVKL